MEMMMMMMMNTITSESPSSLILPNRDDINKALRGANKDLKLTRAYQEVQIEDLKEHRKEYRGLADTLESTRSFVSARGGQGIPYGWQMKLV
jgi:hypothetical protein